MCSQKQTNKNTSLNTKLCKFFQFVVLPLFKKLLIPKKISKTLFVEILIVANNL